MKIAKKPWGFTSAPLTLRPHHAPPAPPPPPPEPEPAAQAAPVPRLPGRAGFLSSPLCIVPPKPRVLVQPSESAPPPPPEDSDGIRPNLRDHLCRQAPWGFTKPQISAGADDPYPITFWIFLPSSLEPLFGAVSKDEPHKIPWARSLFYRLTSIKIIFSGKISEISHVFFKKSHVFHLFPGKM